MKQEALTPTDRALMRRQEALALLTKPKTAGQLRRELGLGKQETFALLLRLDGEQAIKAEQQSGGVVRWRRA